MDVLQQLSGPNRRIPGESRTLSLVDQEALLRKVLGGGGVEDNEESEFDILDPRSFQLVVYTASCGEHEFAAQNGIILQPDHEITFTSC